MLTDIDKARLYAAATKRDVHRDKVRAAKYALLAAHPTMGDADAEALAVQQCEADRPSEREMFDAIRADVLSEHANARHVDGMGYLKGTAS
jgi:hypothetical protein